MKTKKSPEQKQMMLFIGSKVRELRERNGLTTKELAGKMHVGRPYMTKIELGMVDPPATVMVQMAEILDVSLVELVCDLPPILSKLRSIIFSIPVEYQYELLQYAQDRRDLYRLRQGRGQLVNDMGKKPNGKPNLRAVDPDEPEESA
jgi:transcriptional regulator with XRE-family HTH domain